MPKALAEHRHRGEVFRADAAPIDDAEDPAHVERCYGC
jgi:hypothetical protein